MRQNMGQAYRAVIFDFNGVIINDEPLHLELLRRTIIEEGMTFVENDYFEKYLGCDDRRCFERALTDHGRIEAAADPDYVQSLITRKTGYYQESVRSQDLLFPGIAGLIERLAARYPLAIASGALREEVDLALTNAGIAHHFALIVTSEDVRQSKPDPEGYLLALSRLRKILPDLEAGECLVIEDSVAGVTAAKRAGMPCLAVTTSYPATRLSHADWITTQAPDWFTEL